MSQQTAQYWNTKNRFPSVGDPGIPGKPRHINIHAVPCDEYYNNISDYNGWTFEYQFEGIVVLYKGIPENNLNTNIKPQTKSTFRHYI